LIKDFKSEQWLKKFAIQHLSNFEVNFRFFAEADFGSLHQVEFNNDEKGGEIEVWSSGWFRVHLVDYVSGIELMCAFIDPDDEQQDQLVSELIMLLADEA
jgi:hypothetical protein